MLLFSKPANPSRLNNHQVISVKTICCFVNSQNVNEFGDTQSGHFRRAPLDTLFFCYFVYIRWETSVTRDTNFGHGKFLVLDIFPEFVPCTSWMLLSTSSVSRDQAMYLDRVWVPILHTSIENSRSELFLSAMHISINWISEDISRWSPV